MFFIFLVNGNLCESEVTGVKFGIQKFGFSESLFAGYVPANFVGGASSISKFLSEIFTAITEKLQ